MTGADFPIYDRLRGERLADDVPNHGREPRTEELPVLEPRPSWAGENAGAEDLTHDDHLARRTDNGLRPDDELLQQPPQDPHWRPDADR
ncbi:hypothetical protein Psed_5813 [Pseudonocardia dioxanivorans CB1190]|uniref:Uncharacterized protein n=1 Tax=Pseudonocardia dioxanivorans (strain ATCC 55486 / DSM 44775 / JCM 13855 / CB1190) TaxID=675635 RepID=F4D1F0_PSEUX|nr:hypothetical protein [Pseudonocardia dioxanivorans]AEA27938.1 hypothetical protein Psed_5813 [Pseudonocardia dioxanivorans CB1190]